MLYILVMIYETTVLRTRSNTVDNVLGSYFEQFILIMQMHACKYKHTVFDQFAGSEVS